MNTFGNLGGVLSPIVVGWCLTCWGSWEAPLYTVAALYVVRRALLARRRSDRALDLRV